MYSFFQSVGIHNQGKFTIIKGEVTPAGYPRGYNGIDWHYLTHKDKIVLDSLTLSDAKEITGKLNNGARIEDFFTESDYYYGCPMHQALGDSWFYQDCPGAW